MTSLLGFEALLRGRAVDDLRPALLCRPRPYHRHAAMAHAGAVHVDLDTLVAAAFLAYPLYRDPDRNVPVGAFEVLDIIKRQREAKRRRRASRFRCALFAG